MITSLAGPSQGRAPPKQLQPIANRVAAAAVADRYQHVVSNIEHKNKKVAKHLFQAHMHQCDKQCCAALLLVTHSCSYQLQCTNLVTADLLAAMGVDSTGYNYSLCIYSLLAADAVD